MRCVIPYLLVAYTKPMRNKIILNQMILKVILVASCCIFVIYVAMETKPNTSEAKIQHKVCTLIYFETLLSKNTSP